MAFKIKECIAQSQDALANVFALIAIPNDAGKNDSVMVVEIWISQKSPWIKDIEFID